MRVGRRWRELSKRSQRLIACGAAIEALLKVAALVDLRRRPAADIRGSKRRWVAAVVLVNSGGAVPISYLRYGRRKTART